MDHSSPDNRKAAPAGTRWADLVNERDKVSLTVTGGCMFEPLVEGARLEVQKAARYWPGDVVVLRQPDRVLVHRIIGAYRRHGIRKFLTQSDRGSRPDRSSTHGDIIGKVLSVDGAPLSVSIRTRFRSFYKFLRFSSQWLIGRARL